MSDFIEYFEMVDSRPYYELPDTQSIFDNTPDCIDSLIFNIVMNGSDNEDEDDDKQGPLKLIRTKSDTITQTILLRWKSNFTMNKIINFWQLL
eukprot:Awhi_evm3s14048